MLYSKCPVCGKENSVDTIKPGTGTSYVLTEVDTSTDIPNFLPATGMPVIVKGCVNCKMLFLMAPSLSK
ncbi:hypothetical protein C4D34_13715 [Clostridium perfringens]